MLSVLLLAALEAVSPVGGVEVSVVPPCQRRLAALETVEERSRLLKEFAAVRKAGGVKGTWQAAEPIVFSWRTTAGEKGPWVIELSETNGFSDPMRVSVRDRHCRSEGDVCRYATAAFNLKPGTCYRWRVRSASAEGNEGTFRTDDAAPRWIALRGAIGNVRDCGGWMTESGRRVRMGLLFRGQGLNDNSVVRGVPGDNRLTVEDVRYLTGRLGVRTDLDLRGDSELGGLSTSPLGPKVTFIHRSSPAYEGLFTAEGSARFREAFRVLCNRDNYPVYFHCIGGADRTGSLTYMANGLLGVAKRDLEFDWESTFYPKDEHRRHHSTREFDKGLAKYGKPADTLSRKIELFLLDIGITVEEIARFKAIMLEERQWR